MTPRQIVAAALRSNEFKLLETNGWRLNSTERQLNNGTISLRHTLYPHNVTITTYGRVRVNHFAYVHLDQGTPNDRLRDGMKSVINRSFFGTWV